MIGLVLGDTQLGTLIIKKLRLLKIKYTIIDISEKKIFSKDKYSYPLSIGQLGKAITILKKNKCKKVIFAGRVIRPNFIKTKFDLKGLYYLPKIIKSSKKGDAYIIKEIIKIFKKEKIKLINQTYFNKELSIKKRGNITKQKIDLKSRKDFMLGKKIVEDLKKNNVGQAIVVRDSHVIAIENQHGTNFMLKKAHKILKKFYNIKKQKGVLIKFPKTNQDLRIDLPTIGIKTIEQCAKIGLKGIVLKNKYNIVLDKNKLVSFANKKKMFVTIK